MLALSLLVTVAGLGTAIYHERARGLVAATPRSLPSLALAAPADSPPAPASAIERAPSVVPAAAAAAMPAAVEPSPSDVAPAEPPAAGSSTPVPPSAAGPLAALKPPPAAPAAPLLSDGGHYWVEYGVFVGEGYARRLQQALAAHGLASLIVETHAPGGRALRRVRSVALADYAEAREVAERAGRGLAIAPLVHRSAGEPAPVPQPPQALALTSAARGGQRYWVQFGAFPRAEQAQHLKDALGGSGVDTAVSTTRAASGRLLFLVRSVLLPDRGSALALAYRGRQAANVDFLVGRSLEPRRAGITAPPRLAAAQRSTTEPVSQ